MTARGFPPPWSVEELEGCFVVRDSARQDLAYVYFRGGPPSAKVLTRDEALRIAGQLCGAAGWWT